MTVSHYTGSAVAEFERLTAAGPTWLVEIRNAARAKAEEFAWPRPTDEEFRRSSVSDYDFPAYAFEAAATAAPTETGAPPQADAGYAGVLRFRGATLESAWLRSDLAESGVVFASLGADLPVATRTRAAEALDIGLANADNRLSTWHYALLTHGAVLHVSRFAEIREPFLIEFSADGTDLLCAPHVTIVTEEGGRADVVVVHSGEDGEPIVSEGFDALVGAAGSVRLFGVQDLNLDATVVSNGQGTIGRDAVFQSYQCVLGGLFSKYRIDANMAGPGADAFLGGVFLPHEDQHVDLRTVQNHVSPKAHSLTLYKGAVQDEAHSVYQGLIRVDHDALSTDAYLTNNNLILSEEARSDSIPTLQINTDEVRCSHGSTTGKLDPRQLYYLYSRGYSPAEAKRILVRGFLEELIAVYPEAVAERVASLVEARIKDAK